MKTIVINEDLHTSIKKHCKKNRIKLNEYIEKILQDHLDFKLEEKSILPMRLRDDSGEIRETVICTNISGEFKKNLPAELTLMRTIKGESGFIANYKQV